MNKEYILNYIKTINGTMNANISVTVEEATLLRYALYGYCIGNKVFCWSALFDVLGEYHKQLHIIHAYAIIYDAEISRSRHVNKDKDMVQVIMDPNRIAKIICEFMKIKYLSFEELQKEIYTIKAKVFPFPDSKGTYFKIGDRIRSGLTKFEVTDIFADNDIIMVSVCSVNSFDNKSRIITLPELEMMQYYRIVDPVELKKEK
ncbi:MAG: hypothetical protein UIH27_09035 [Ruminococcus sp.]|nr:hypothetical protein [Ruminococcus sp.]